MKRHNRILAILLCNLFAYAIVRELNSALAGYSVHLTIDALFLLFPALYFPLFDGLIIVVITALLTDAWLPVPYGTSLYLFLIAYGLASLASSRMHRENKAQVIWLALSLNTGFMLVLTVLMAFLGPADLFYWIRNIFDAMFSLSVLALIAGWWVDLQRALLTYFGGNFASELPAY